MCQISRFTRHVTLHERAGAVTKPPLDTVTHDCRGLTRLSVATGSSIRERHPDCAAVAVQPLRTMCSLSSSRAGTHMPYQRTASPPWPLQLTPTRARTIFGAPRPLGCCVSQCGSILTLCAPHPAPCPIPRKPSTARITPSSL